VFASIIDICKDPLGDPDHVRCRVEIRHGGCGEVGVKTKVSCSESVTAAVSLICGTLVRRFGQTEGAIDNYSAVTKVGRLEVALGIMFSQVASPANHSFTAGQDSFVFAPNFGQVTITNFDPAKDTIQISQSIFPNISALLAATHDDAHGNAIITAGRLAH
jgi:hypothetical protein